MQKNGNRFLHCRQKVDTLWNRHRQLWDDVSRSCFNFTLNDYLFSVPGGRLIRAEKSLVVGQAIMVSVSLHVRNWISGLKHLLERRLLWILFWSTSRVQS